MKPKFRRLYHAVLPVLIIVPAVVHTAIGATIAPDGFGNVTANPGDSGANNIATGFGFVPAIPPGAHNILINPGVTLNPTGTDVIEIQVFDVVGATYTITNNGILKSDNGAANHGIDTIDIGGTATPSITVINNNFISGASAIRANNMLVLTNNTGGTLQGFGGADGAVFAKKGGNITNNTGATITGLAYGIRGESGTLVVGNTGLIEGTAAAAIGISTDGTLTLTNGVNSLSGLGTIQGGAGGVKAGANSTITNNLSGSIFGGVTVVQIGADSSVNNSGNIIASAPGATGILGDNGVQVINNSGSIYGGVGGNAMDLQGGSDIVNLSDGSTVSATILGGTGANILNFGAGLTGIYGSQDTTHNIVYGDVKEFSIINKAAEGTAFIGDYSEFRSVTVDTINVGNGGLIINGDLAGNSGPTATVNASASEFGGRGTWVANINVNAGAFSAGGTTIALNSNPNNAVGALTVNGNVTHAAGSYLRVDVIPQTAINNGVNSDLVVQTGANTYNLGNNGLHLSPTNVNRAITNGTYTVVDSANAISGFNAAATLSLELNTTNPAAAETGPFTATESGTSTNTVLGNFFATTQLAGGGTDVQLVVQHNFAGLPGLTANQASLGAALDASVNSPNPLMQDFIAALDYSNLPAVQATLAAIDPSTYLALTSSIINSDYALHRQIGDRLSDLRDAGDGGGVYRTQVSAKGGMAPTPSVSSSGPFNVWGAVSYDWQDYSGRTALSDFDGTVASFTAGIDYRVSPDFVIGVLVNGSKSDLDYVGGSTDIDSLRGAIYATYGRSTGWYSDALIGYGSHSIDASRTLGGVVIGAGGSDVDATSFQALWTVGYTFDTGTFRHGPFLGLEYQNVDVDGFTVGGPFPVGVGDYSVDSLRGLIGYRIRGDCGTFRPYASIAYAHEFEDGGNSASAFLPNGAPFSVVGPDLNSAVLLTAGTGIRLSDDLILDVGYRGEISTESEGLDSHGGSIGLNYNF
ncbi:autotransporter domain-containing protein [Luteolibacter ambystomatis]|uniref:Autotransporter domain-containing protein n=1 Tax=Luteolibacter ambystomatis TaxID=2824561 RepID=A0A975IXS4_9BACT|nr:autotransporter outer membrane beta-barrel domain-containing protein [Luteolibacter ambystomatis]QUE49379.1 autotransporter domain-containing protein [Luteolibacter ambystomatis]